MFKRSGKRILSVLLAMVVVLGSIPFVFQGTVNAAYFSDGSKWVRTGSDYGKIKATLSNIDFKFMQTEDNQEFTFNQHLSLEKDAGEAYAHFNSLTLYAGGTNTDSSLKVEEYPENITTNGTQNMVDKMNLKYAWSASNDNARDVGVSGSDIPSHDLRGTVVDLSDCPDYQWDCNLSFNAVHPENTPYGEIKTNYYWDFNWTYADVGLMGSRTKRQVRVCTDIVITDVRELKNKVEEFKSQIENYENGNSQGLSEERYLKIKKYVNAVPTNMLDGSRFFTQTDVDAMYDYITETATGLADYSEYYSLRKKLSEIVRKTTDENPTYVYCSGYTTESLDIVANELVKIDEGLNKNLMSPQQDVVDEATEGLKTLTKKLTAKSLYSADKSGTTTDDVFDTCVDGPDANLDSKDGTEMNFHLIVTKYKFMQIYDDELFTVDQQIYASSRANDFGMNFPYIEAFTFDENSCSTDCFYKGEIAQNNTTKFLSKVLPEYLSVHENGSKEFNNWQNIYPETTYNGREQYKAVALATNKYIDRKEIGGSGIEGIGSRHGYWAQADIEFRGNGSDVTSAEDDLSFVWRLQVNDDDANDTTYHLHLPVEVKVTDARDLVKLYDELTELSEDSAERLKYTAASIDTLAPALNVIPTDLLYGSAYYTQTEVDSYYSMILDAKNALEPVADYTAYDETYEEAKSITNDDNKYEPSAFASYVATIDYVNSGLDRRLGETQQETVDEATALLNKSMVVLEQNAYCDYTELKEVIAYAKEKFPSANIESDDVYNAMLEALAKAEAIDPEMVKGVDNANQKIIDDAKEELLYAIYYEYYDSLSKEIINGNNENNGDKIYLDEDFNKFKEDYAAIVGKLENDVNDDSISNKDAFKDATTDLADANTSLEEAKFVDLTEIKDTIEEAKEKTNEGYTDSSWNELQEAIKNAETIVLTNPVQGENGSGTKEVEQANQAIKDALANLQIKADYSELEKAIEDAENILNDTETTYTESSKKVVSEAYELANELDKDLPESEQARIDEIASELEKAVAEIKVKADYSAINSLIEQAREILNSTDVVYTDSSKSELKRNYDIAVALDKDLPESEQGIINSVISDLSAAVTGMKVKADYSALDEVVEKAKEALNRTDVKYTANTEQILRDALTSAEDVTRDLSTDDQKQIDDVVEIVKNATDMLTEAADLSEYKEALEKAAEILEGDNSDNRYDEEDFKNFVNIVIDASSLVGEDSNNIPKTEQDNIDSATETIKNATEEIYNKRYIFVNFKGESNEIYKPYRVPFSDELTFGDLKDIPELPESDGFKKYIGWYYENNTTMKLTDAITEDVDVFCYEEEIKLVTKAESGAVIDETNHFFKGLKHGTTVENLKATLDNKLDYIVIKNVEGNVVDNSALIATGMTIELVSRGNNAVVNESVTVVVRGDINGDGLVNDDDYEKSRGMCIKTTEYTETEKAFFAANDTDGDGVLDVIDLFNISNMRYGN